MDCFLFQRKYRYLTVQITVLQPEKQGVFTLAFLKGTVKGVFAPVPGRDKTVLNGWYYGFGALYPVASLCCQRSTAAGQ